MKRQVVSLDEWSEVQKEGLGLEEGDRRLVQALRDARRLKIDELRTGLRVESYSWVGVISLTSFDVCVTPKLAGGSRGLVEMLARAFALNERDYEWGARTLDTSDHDDLLDLVALAFVVETERIVRSGLLEDYIEHEDDLPVLRGRLLADRQVRRRLGRLDRVECRFDERSNDVLENRILATALTVLRRRVRRSDLRARVHRLAAELSVAGAGTIGHLAQAKSKLEFGRSNRHYRGAIEIAWLILENLAVEDVLRVGQLRSFAFMIDMNALFERFVEVVVRTALAGTAIDIRTQWRERGIIWDVSQNRPYTYAQPDILVEPVEKPSSPLAVDAKYKLYDQRSLDGGDLYQAFLYAYAFSEHDQRRALILYPSERPTPLRSLQVRTRSGQPGATLGILGLPLPVILEELRAKESGASLTTLHEALTSLLAVAGQ